MAISLSKGQALNLTKTTDNRLSEVIVGLGWDEVPKKKAGLLASLFGTLGPSIDCDSSAFLLKNNKISDSDDIVCYHNRHHKSRAVNHQGDNLTGAGDGDDEQIVIDLKRIPDEYNKIVIVVNIYSAKQKGQHFGMIQNAFIRIVDKRNNKELCRFNLSENYNGMTAMVFGELSRGANDEWSFTAIGKGNTANSIEELAHSYR